GGVTAGHPVTITAQAQNITHPVYQFWIDQNGHWTGSNYASNNAFTFTPKTANFEVAVYAKTVEEPNNAGTNLGITPETATTPKIFAMNTANAQGKSSVISALQQKSFWKNTNGVATPQLVGAPSESVIKPLIPASLPPNGTITGATALLKANPHLLTQAQAIGQVQGITVTPQILEAGMHKAAQAFMTYEGNDPATLTSLLGPGILLPNYHGTTILPAVHNLLNDYWGGYSIEETHNYAYGQSAVINSTTAYPTVSVQNPQRQAPTNLPQKLLNLKVPVMYTEVMNYQQAGYPDRVWVMRMQGDFTVTLFRDPLIPGGLQWGMDNLSTKTQSSSVIWPTS
ncbi:MAG: hypothetical protein C7B43_21265, partial [Sulfobacillus benefaciens]